MNSRKPTSPCSSSCHIRKIVSKPSGCNLQKTASTAKSSSRCPSSSTPKVQDNCVARTPTGALAWLSNTAEKTAMPQPAKTTIYGTFASKK